MLSFQNVTKQFQLDDQTTITPVKNVTLNIEPGELIIIIGRSGSGKTTLLNLAAGLVKPTSGKVVLDNLSLGEMSDGQLSRVRSQRLGFVFQFPSLLSALTVQDNVALPTIFASPQGKQAVDEKVKNILKLMGLGSKLDVYPKQLSAGEQKRVVIARALINQPQLVLADEPTSDLDEQTEKEVMELLRNINASGVTFLIVTHSLELVPYATRAFRMENGGLTDVTGLKNPLKTPVGSMV
jgi:putative ABC transport system ATP-binding protein